MNIHSTFSLFDYQTKGEDKHYDKSTKKGFVSGALYKYTLICVTPLHVNRCCPQLAVIGLLIKGGMFAPQNRSLMMISLKVLVINTVLFKKQHSIYCELVVITTTSTKTLVFCICKVYVKCL